VIRRVFVFLVLLAAVAHAQPETGAVSLPPEPTPPAPTGSAAPVEDAQPMTADRATCLRLDTTPGALLESTQGGGAGGLDTPIP
jgi:hypothetical protein